MDICPGEGCQGGYAGDYDAEPEFHIAEEPHSSHGNHGIRVAVDGLIKAIAHDGNGSVGKKKRKKGQLGFV